MGVNEFSYRRAISIINRMIEKLQLNLKGFTVLTEVGSNYYLYAPIIAKLAGADKVIAWSKDSIYGKAIDITQECLKIASILNIEEDLVLRVNEYPNQDIEEADILTNSGVLRPLDGNKLKNAKKDCVIPVMYEAWELRNSDIDIGYCKLNSIRVAGTWENHPSLKVFDYGGVLAVKLALEAGFEVFENKILIWSDDHFGEVAESTFKNMGANTVIRTTDYQCLKENLKDLDFIYICKYNEVRNYLGKNGIFSIDDIISINPTITLIHLYGRLSISIATKHNINIYPKKDGHEMLMTETLGYVGLEPILRLQVAGFKVAEELLHKKLTELTQVIV